MKLLIATHNVGKFVEFKQLLKDYFDEIISMDELDKDIMVEETGATFQQNAKKKAFEVAKKTGYITLGDDSGIVVDALMGTPGVYSARYSKNGDDESNNAKLLSKMQGKEKRSARFVCALALYNPENASIIEVTGSCEGLITEKPVGVNGFGYDPLFYFEDAGLTFGQMTDDEKNKVSHRRNAINALIEIIERNVSRQTSIFDKE